MRWLKGFWLASVAAACSSFSSDPAVPDGGLPPSGSDASATLEDASVSDGGAGDAGEEAGRSHANCALLPILVVDFEDANNLALDTSARHLAGTATSVTQTADGAFGSAGAFGGSGLMQYGTDPAFDLAGDFTIAFWMFSPVGTGPDASASDQSIFGRPWTGAASSSFYDYGVELDVSSTMNVQLFLGDVAGGGASDVQSSVPSPPPGQWFHVAFVSAGAQLSSYLNGAKQDTRPGRTVNTNHETAKPFRVGKDPYDLQTFTGRLDDLRLYGRALEAEQIGCLAQR